MAITTFVANTILTAAQMNALQANDYNQTVSTKTADYTLVAADKGTKIVMNSASATTITVNTSLFSAGDTLTILNIAAGVCTVTAGTATVSTTGSLALAQNGGGTLYFTSAGVSVFLADGVAAAASALVRVGGGTLSGASTTFSAVFSATYDQYLVSITNLQISSATRLAVQLALNGTASTTGYQTVQIGNSSTTVTALDIAGDNYPAFELTTTAGQGGSIIITNPFLAVASKLNTSSLYVPATAVVWNSLGTHNVSTSYNDLIMFVSSGSFTSGKVNIYGYSLS